MLGLAPLRYEVYSDIVSSLSYENVFNLRQTCKGFNPWSPKKSPSNLGVYSRLYINQDET
jgi:hypothetical protein